VSTESSEIVECLEAKADLGRLGAGVPEIFNHGKELIMAKKTKNSQTVVKPEEQTEIKNNVASEAADSTSDRGTQKPLDETEKKLLKSCEETIAAGLNSCFQIGAALQTILDQRLYKQDSPSFDKYCEMRWKFSGSHGRRRINEAKFRSKANEYVSPKGEKMQVLPENEAQIRPIIDKVKEDKWMSTWEKVVRAAKKLGRSITGEFVQECVSSSKAKPEQKAKVISTPPPENGGGSSGQEGGESKIASECVSLVKQAKDMLKADDKKGVRNLLNQILRLLKGQSPESVS